MHFNSLHLNVKTIAEKFFRFFVSILFFIVINVSPFVFILLFFLMIYFTF